MNYSNKNNYSLPIAVWLANNDYDNKLDEYTFSATELTNNIKKIVLGRRAQKEDKQITDVSDVIASRIGQSLHKEIEESFKKHYINRMKVLNYPEEVIKQIVINPEKDKELAIYMEQRSNKKINKYTINGQYDFIIDGQLHDIKTADTFNYKNKRIEDKYIIQGSIYRWLNPELIRDDYLYINYIFKKWSANQLKINKDYPPNQITVRKLLMMDLGETDYYLRHKISEIEKYYHASESIIPECNDEDLWRDKPVFKYYRNPEKTKRSTANFDNINDANIRLAKDGGTGIVKEIKSNVKACFYCPAFVICTQKDKLIESKDLVI